jgi:hypothetical protein
MTCRCFTTDVTERYLYGKLPRWQSTICRVLEGGGGTLTDQTTKGGGNSVGSTQLGGPGFTSPKSADVRLKEHQRYIRLEHPEKSALAEHSINQGHRILFHDASIINASAKYMDRIVREAIDVVLHPFNMNKEDGFCLSRLW